ncbi:endonuclease domain-containing protein [Streptomyces sp. DH12]|uniref:endonuclease domain-containing protein n=1 Tax=Streptomyces sp. DH12 TaxID=2857010 RepID=UPI0034D570F8
MLSPARPGSGRPARDLARQRCAACGHRWPGDLVVDHCHQAGLVRRLLCAVCNTAEGTAPPRHPRWLSYRALTPALILGVHLLYNRVVRRRLSPRLSPMRTSTARPEVAARCAAFGSSRAGRLRGWRVS